VSVNDYAWDYRIAILVGATFGDAKLIHPFEHLGEYLASHTRIRRRTEAGGKFITILVEQFKAGIALAGAKVIRVKLLIIIKVGKYINTNAPAILQLLAWENDCKHNKTTIQI